MALGADGKSAFRKLAQDRTTVYEFSPKLITESQIYEILEAGRWAPSAGNLQPWHFIVILNKDVIHRLVKDAPYGKFHNDPPIMIALVLCSKRWFASGHTVIKKLGRVSYPEAYLSMGMPAINMVLCAQDLGIGSCILTPNGQTSAKLLKLESQDRVVLFIGLGYEKEGAFQKKNSRTELDDLVSFDTFENKQAP